MGLIITSCFNCPVWIEKALAKVARFDDFGDDETFGIDVEIDDLSEIAQEAKKARADYERRKKIENAQAKAEALKAARDVDISGQLINPTEWGKGGKRPIAVKPSVKSRAQKGVYAVTKGLHPSIPLDEIFDALKVQGLIPIQEDGYKWSGWISGGHECGSDEARSQNMSLPLVTKNADGQWALTTLYLYMSHCTTSSGKYEVVCYVS